MREQFKDLNLNNWFLFVAVLEDPEACRLVLEIILGRKISKVNVRTEHSIFLNSDARCIRLDVHATDEFNMNYNLEAQNSDYKKDIARRSRYYQAEMDVAALKPGEPFENLPDSFVIFICTFDPFGRGRYCYTFREVCEEDGQPLGDGTVKIFLSTKGQNAGEVPKELVHFLGYFVESTDKYVATVNEDSIRTLHEKVTTLKKSREWEAGYMKFEELMNRQKSEGFAEGELKGKLEAICLLLSELGELPDEVRATLEAEADPEKLAIWLKLAAKAESINAFVEQM